jgi:hypothetical protein
MQTPGVDPGQRKPQQIRATHVDDQGIRFDDRGSKIVGVGDVLHLRLETSGDDPAARRECLSNQAPLSLGRLPDEDLALRLDRGMCRERRDQPRTPRSTGKDDDEGTADGSR